MLDNLRGALAPALARLGAAFASTGLPPSAWTGAGLALAAGAAAAYATGHPHAALAGGALLLASGFFDVVDGQVARAAGKSSKRGAFLDSMSDKAGEAAVFAGVLAGGLAAPLPVLAAAMLSLLVSYSRARAESLGVELRGIGVGERAERLLVLAAAGMAGFMDWAVWAVAALAAATLAHRAAVTARALRG